MTSSVSPEGLAGHLAARMSTVRQEISEIEGENDPAPESLHNLHRDLRRLWIEYGLWRDVAPRSTREEVRRLRQRVRRLSRLVGQVRDFDVGLQLVAGAASAPSSSATAMILVGAHHRMQDDSRLGRELLRAYIRTERDSGLLDSIDRTVGPPMLRVPSGQLIRQIGRHRERYDERLQRGFRKARRDPKAKNLHRLRGRIRQTRYFREMLKALGETEGTAVPRRLVDLERQLGRLNDVAVLSRHVERQGPEVRDAAWADDLRAQVRERQKKLASEIRRKRVRTAIGHLKP